MSDNLNKLDPSGGAIRRPSLTGSKRALLARDRPHVSFEFFPPKTAAGWSKLQETGRQLTTYSPDFASVTFGAGGSANQHTLEACVVVRDAMGVDVVPHLSCLGKTPEQIRSHLDQYREAKFQKLLALRGDVPLGIEKTEDVVIPEGGFRHANELVSYIKGRGDFHIFVACYPEGHPEASNLKADVDNFLRKVESGADAAITQYFFNNAAYFHFVEEVRRRGVEVPIIVGLMPIYPFDQVLSFSQKCGADVPMWIRKRMEVYQDDPVSQLALAVEIAVKQADELLRAGAPGIHFYTLNRTEATTQICDELSPRPADLGISWDDVAYRDA